MIAFIIAIFLDAPVAEFMRSSGVARFIHAARWWPEAIKAPGNFWFAVTIAVLLWLFRKAGWKASLFVILAGMLGGINALIKWMVGRTRPFKLPGEGLRPFEFHPFWHGWYGLWNQKDLSFPSGHECEAFALAAAICIVWPRGGWFLICWAALVGLERICENAHYCSDVVAAIGISIAGVALLHLALADWMKLPRKPGFLVKVSPIAGESGTL